MTAATRTPAEVRVAPTLKAMADIYRLPREGGPRSPRFQTYLRVIREHEWDSYQAYNPMAGQTALDTVERLLAIEAETVTQNSVQETLSRCRISGPIDLAVIVATPGMWTHRLITEAEHRLREAYPSRSHVQMWAGEPAEVEDVRREAAAEAVRMAWSRLHGPAQKLSSALVREGLALALSCSALEPLSPAEQGAVRDAVAVLGDSPSRADVLGVGYGDSLAAELGWKRLGLPDRGGCRFAAELATEWLATLGPAEALHEPPAALTQSFR